MTASDDAQAALLSEVREFLADDGVLITAPGEPARRVAAAFGDDRHREIAPDESSGAWLAAALDVTRALPDREVLAICHRAAALVSDGAAAAAAVPLVVLVLAAESTPEADALENAGWHVQRVPALDELQTALAAAFASGGAAAIFFAP